MDLTAETKDMDDRRTGEYRILPGFIPEAAETRKAYVQRIFEAFWRLGERKLLDDQVQDKLLLGHGRTDQA